jgi:hypothetical protein
MPNNFGYAVLSYAAAELAEHIHSVKMITSVKESRNFIECFKPCAKVPCD